MKPGGRRALAIVALILAGAGYVAVLFYASWALGPYRW